MKKFLIAAAGLVAFAAPALAADMAPAPYTKAPPVMVASIYNWTGFYVGGNVGGMWTNESVFWPGTAIPINSFNHNTSQGVYGGHVGFQYQWAHFVLGVEAAGFDTFNHALVTGSPQTGCPNPAFTCQASLNSIWTIGPRAGYAFNDWLFYGTGGYANGHVGSNAFNTATLVVQDNLTARRDGWFAGAGVEYAVWKTSSFDGIVGVEYQHIDLGRVRLFSPADGNVFGANTRDVSAKSDLVRLRFSLKFNPMGGPVVAKY